MLNNEKETEIKTLLKRAELLLEDSNWSASTEYYEKVLDIEPENAQAYLGLLLSSLKLNCEKELVSSDFVDNNYFKRALQFADAEYKNVLIQYITENTYLRASYFIEKSEFVTAVELLKEIPDYKDSKNLIEQCEASILEQSKAKEIKKKKIKIIGIISIAVVIVSIILGISIRLSANNKKADEIYNNFIGQKFSRWAKYDDGFYDDYSDGLLLTVKTYRLTQKTYSLEFKEDGTVYYKHIENSKVLYAPSGADKSPTNEEKDGTYDTYTVSVDFDGTVYLKMGYSEYEVEVTDDNVPELIKGYNGMDLQLKEW